MGSPSKFHDEPGNLPLPPFPVPVQSADLMRLRGSASVQLFLDRAREASNEEPSTDEDLCLIGEICRLADGLPLMIELAAGWLAVLTLRQIRHELDRDRLRLVDSTTDSALRTAMVRSVELLPEFALTTWRRMSVIQSPIPLDAVRAITESFQTDRDVLLELRTLVERSIVQKRDGPYVAFDQVSVLRAYASRLLIESGEESTARRAHAVYFAQFARQHGQRLRGRDAGTALVLLNEQHPNLVHALGWAATADIPLALELGGALGRFWQMRGYWTLGLQLLVPALRRSGGAADPDPGARHCGPPVTSHFVSATTRSRELITQNY